MKWTYSIKNKMLASGVLLLLCLLVLFSHYIDRDHTQKVKNAISTLYEDRLIAEVYIQKMTAFVYQIKAELQNENSKQSNIYFLLDEVKIINTAYLKTKFTPLEQQKADTLLMTLYKMEMGSHLDKNTQLANANTTLNLLDELSAIQLAESKQIMAAAETLYLSGKTSSQFVFALIILILLVLQALVFASKTLVVKEVNPGHN